MARSINPDICRVFSPVDVSRCLITPFLSTWKSDRWWNGMTAVVELGESRWALEEGLQSSADENWRRKLFLWYVRYAIKLTISSTSFYSVLFTASIFCVKYIKITSLRVSSENSKNKFRIKKKIVWNKFVSCSCFSIITSKQPSLNHSKQKLFF